MKLRFSQLAVAASLAFASTSSTSLAQPGEPPAAQGQQRVFSDADIGLEYRDTAEDKLRSLHLRSEDIKDELARTGRVVRRKASEAGHPIAEGTADARITAAIKAKLVADRDLSALNVSAKTSAGVVTFKGTVSSPEHISKAILLAMETAGVREVISELGTAAVPAVVNRKEGGASVEVGKPVRRDEFGGIALDEAPSGSEVVGKLVRRGNQGEFVWLEKPKRENRQAGTTQIVEVEGMGLHEFPSEVTPDEITEAINNSVESRQERDRTATTIDFQPAPQQDLAGWAIFACFSGFLVIGLLWLYFSPSSRGRSPPGSLPHVIEAVSPSHTVHLHPSRLKDSSPAVLGEQLHVGIDAAPLCLPAASLPVYFILHNNEPEGPYTIEDLRSLWNSGAVTGETFYCEEGAEAWLHLEAVADRLQSSSVGRTSVAETHTNLSPLMTPPPLPSAAAPQKPDSQRWTCHLNGVPPVPSAAAPRKPEELESVPLPPTESRDSVSPTGQRTTADGYITANCQFCGGSIEFPEHGLGEWVDCPHCNRQLQLRRMGATERFLLGVRVWCRERSFSWKWASALIAVVLVCGTALFIYADVKAQATARAEREAEAEESRNYQRNYHLAEQTAAMQRANEIAQAAQEKAEEKAEEEARRKELEEHPDSLGSFFRPSLAQQQLNEMKRANDMAEMKRIQPSDWYEKFRQQQTLDEIKNELRLQRNQYVPPTARLQYNAFKQRWEWVP